jgi:hypothetical protein
LLEVRQRVVCHEGASTNTAGTRDRQAHIYGVNEMVSSRRWVAVIEPPWPNAGSTTPRSFRESRTATSQREGGGPPSVGVAASRRPGERA